MLRRKIIFVNENPKEYKEMVSTWGAKFVKERKKNKVIILSLVNHVMTMTQRGTALDPWKARVVAVVSSNSVF